MSPVQSWHTLLWHSREGRQLAHEHHITLHTQLTIRTCHRVVWGLMFMWESRSSSPFPISLSQQNQSHHLKNIYPKQGNLNFHKFTNFMMQADVVPVNISAFVPVLWSHIPKLAPWRQGVCLCHQDRISNSHFSLLPNSPVLTRTTTHWKTKAYTPGVDFMGDTGRKVK
jgi:hypothetical protein